MGKTGELGPPAPMTENAQSPRAPSLTADLAGHPLTLRGSDLYRFSCRGCHGEAGLGAPPEIHSVINPVRATSVGMVMERMKSTGMEITRADASQLAKQAKDSLLLRFQKGGESMPPFDHLRPIEERLIIGYLEELAAVPGSSAAHEAVKVSPARAGELIVKSTCHICHDATGANPDTQQILQGAIPPLSTLTSRTTEAEFVRKVTHGAPVLMGNPPMLERGRMPVFYYLTEDEAADVYLYLMLHPPNQQAGQENLSARRRDRVDSTFAAAGVAGNPPGSPPPPPGIDGAWLLLGFGLVLVVSGLLLGGLAITVREFSRLSTQSETRESESRERKSRQLVPHEAQVHVLQV